MKNMALNDIPLSERTPIMAETKQSEPTIVVINETPHPSTKQQLTSALIQVGTAVAVPLVIAAGFAVVGTGAKVVSKIRRSKPQTTDSSTKDASN
jgi:hypothetical protein